MKVAKLTIIASILILAVTVITNLPINTHAAGLTATAQKTNTIALATKAAKPVRRRPFLRPWPSLPEMS